MKLISAFGAADMLELDRQTVRRALRNVKPDAYERQQPRWRLPTILAALDSYQGRVHGTARTVADTLRSRLGEIADELERTHKQLDAKRELIKAQPTIDAKNPHLRATVTALERLSDLYDEADAIMHKVDPLSPLPAVSRQIVGSEFRELLAAIWGRDMTIDGMLLFPNEAA
jgi:hypothetical protein